MNRDRKGRFLKRSKRKARRARPSTSRKAKRTTRRASTRKAPPAPRRRRSAPRVSGLRSLVTDAAAVTGGIVAAGALARTGIVDTPVKRAALVGAAAVLVGTQARRLARLPLLSTRIVQGAAVGMAADAVWRVSAPYVGNVPGLNAAAKAAGLLAGPRRIPAGRRVAASRATFGPRSTSEALAFLNN